MRVVDTMEDDQERGTGFGGTRDDDSDARLRARALALAARRKVKIKVGKGRPHGGISDRLFGLSNTGQYIRGPIPTPPIPPIPPMLKCRLSKQIKITKWPHLAPVSWQHSLKHLRAERRSTSEPRRIWRRFGWALDIWLYLGIYIYIYMDINPFAVAALHKTNRAAEPISRPKLATLQNERII